MYEIIETVIAAGGFKLADMQHKIKKLYIQGDLTETQMDSLLSMASHGATTEAEQPQLLDMLQTLADKLEALSARVDALDGSSDDNLGYPVWKAWDGMSNDYHFDSIVLHKGQLWQSVYTGQNVWEPGMVDERFWIAYTPEE